MMKIKNIIGTIILIIALLALAVSARDVVMYGDLDGRGYWGVKNMSNISTALYCNVTNPSSCYTLADITAAGGAGSGTVESVSFDEYYITGGPITTTGTGTFNETRMNATIDDRDTDTTYTASGTLLDLTTTTFSVNEGTLTDGKGCKYVAATGLVCDQDYSITVGTVTDVSATSPIVSSGGATPAISATIAKDLVTTAPLTGSVDNILLGTDSDLTIGIDVLKDLVTTAPLTGSTNNVFTGTDSDITIAMPVATTSADGYLSQTDWDTFNNKADTDTTYSAGNGISESSEVFSVAGNTALTQDADGLSVTADGITDTQLEYNTGQHLTTVSNVVHNSLNITTDINMTSGNVTSVDCIVFDNDAKICEGS